eukprot:gb/GEZN01004809.1/.p1 GENE.gb/GEZN01004809.1/~~gb/GEZN01004809.1/.p1  ORF type:complete len:507 (-),score=86.60 gb/GEZN01004809.1/:379-1827(-)
MASSHVMSVLKTKAYADREATAIKVEDVSSFPITSILKTFPDMPRYPNLRVRVREKKDGEARTLHAQEDAKYNQYIGADEICLMQTALRPGKVHHLTGFHRAGPRIEKVWSPKDVRAVILTCGGLCPGLNDVIAEIFHCLYWNYGVDEIYGIRNGYGGVYNKDVPWMKLTPELLKDVHTMGGTIIGSDRGGFDTDKMFQAFVDNGITQVYVVGGDGTHRGADRLAEEALRRKLKMTVACVPKTIDNDIAIIDRSFGFDTAVSEAVKAIRSAVVEASCAPNGIGLVKLMGRDAGFISAHATLASREVDLCLIPEVQIEMEGEDGVLATIEQAIKYKGWAVVVVAEGAGADLCEASKEKDASGNPVPPAIGDFLKKEIGIYFKKKKKKVSIKYHDPSYMIRSVPANASDSVMCIVLAQNAVHGAMAGMTAFTSALVNNRAVILPISLVTASSPSHLNPKGRTWERVIGLTHQPVFKPHKPKAKL